MLLSIAAPVIANGSRGAIDGLDVLPPGRSLPPLANTAEGDRPLLREVSDDHVHDAAAPLPPAAAAETTPADAWARVRAARRLEVPDNPLVRAEMDALRDQALWIGKILHRATPFLAHVVDELDARYLPLELALVPAIESGFRPRALSPEQAAGLWQLMPETANEVGVERDDWYDGRGDVVAATAAALDYLSYLNAEFHGDWELTLAAYNAGLGRVRSAIRRNRAAGLPTDFWSLALPAETRAYVPKILALLAFLRDDGGAGLDVPHVPLENAFVRVDVGRRISIDQAAAVGGVPESLLRRLNAGLLHGVTPPGGPHALYVPREARARFLARLDAGGAGPLFSLPRSHEVVAGDTLGAIALTYGVSEERLMALNDLEDSRIRIGQRLAVLDARHADGVSVEHVVASGDTLSGIARRYDVGVGDITDRDGRALQADLIHPGDTLLVNLLASGPG